MGEADNSRGHKAQGNDLDKIKTLLFSVFLFKGHTWLNPGLTLSSALGSLLEMLKRTLWAVSYQARIGHSRGLHLPSCIVSPSYYLALIEIIYYIQI